MLSRDALRGEFLASARDILASDGYGALKQARLCKSRGVTTGAFYHLFDSWTDFTTALLDDWSRQQAERITEIVRDTVDPVERLRILARTLEHRTDAAIRVWAGVDDDVAELQREVERGRYRVVHEAMTAVVGANRADAFAVWVLSTMVGYDMLAKDHCPEQLMWSLEEVLAVARSSATAISE